LCVLSRRTHVRYVYLLQSMTRPDQRYVGITSHLRSRIEKHNSGSSPHTSKYRPWQLVVALRFEDDHRAAAFEQYLKSGSGRAFAARHFLRPSDGVARGQP